MTYSMTAFASFSQNTEFGDIVCEIRSVNSRFLDQNIYLPDICKHLEEDISKLVKSRLARGKLDVKFFISATSDLENIELNTNLAEELISILQNLNEKALKVGNVKTSIDLSRFLQYPNLLVYKQNLDDNFKQTCLAIVNATLDQLIQARKLEGDKLGEFILEKAYLARDYLEKIKNLSGDCAEELKDKLNAKLTKLDTEIDETKLAQEVALMVQKSDIKEEIDRIETHLYGVEEVLKENQPIGRKLDFLMQELQREVNTLSAKACKIEINKAAIELKVLNEQIREQVQNLE